MQGKRLAEHYRRIAVCLSSQRTQIIKHYFIYYPNANAMYNLGCCYADGNYGLAQNVEKALELWHQAAELGNAKSYYSIGVAYDIGNGVERDEKKARHYYELGAMGGVYRLGTI